MSKRKKTDYIVVHSSQTVCDPKITINTLDEWHRKRGWLTVGYHFVIECDGTIKIGRGINEVGAHVKDMNANSVSLCMIGGLDKNGNPDDNFNPEQWESLTSLLLVLTSVYPDAKVVGHGDLVDTPCPSFNIPEFWDKTRNILFGKVGNV